MGAIKQGPFLEGGFFEEPTKSTFIYPLFSRPYVWSHLDLKSPVKAYASFPPCHVARWNSDSGKVEMLDWEVEP